MAVDVADDLAHVGEVVGGVVGLLLLEQLDDAAAFAVAGRLGGVGGLLADGPGVVGVELSGEGLRGHVRRIAELGDGGPAIVGVGHRSGPFGGVEGMSCRRDGGTRG